MAELMKTYLFKNIGLTDEEKKFLEDAGTMFHDSDTPTNRAKRNLARIMSEMYSMKHSEKNTNALINSNKELAISTGEHAMAMRRLTTALLIVAGLQVILFAIQLSQSYQ